MPPTTDERTTLLLVRHAETIWNAERRYAGHREVALAPGSAEQIARLTPLLVAEHPSVVYSSPLTRCLETIYPTAKALNLSIHLELGLRERNLGQWEGRSEAEIRREHPNFHFPLDGYSGAFEVPGSEPIHHLQRRIQAVMQRAAERHPGECILLGTHAGVIWTILSLLNDTAAPPPWPANTMILHLHYEDASFRIATTVEAE